MGEEDGTNVCREGSMYPTHEGVGFIAPPRPSPVFIINIEVTSVALIEPDN
jgi:hypothetical protein